MVGELPWQILLAAGLGVLGVPTVGVTVTVVDAEDDGPLQPLAVTLTVALPVKPAPQVTVAVVPVPEIELPEPLTVQL